MKLKTFICLLGATVLVGISACQREISDTPENEEAPTEVNTKFVFSLDLGNGNTATKQTAADTQADISQPFRGLSSAYLAAYKLASDGKKVTDPDMAAEKWFPLGELVSAGEIDPDATAGSGIPQSRRVIELSLPSGTNTMVFYGQASKTSTDAQQGKVSIVGGTNLTATTINMQPRLPANTSEDYKLFAQSYKMIALVLNYIINFGVNGPAADEIHHEAITETYGVYTFNSELKWKDYARTDGKSPVAEALGITTEPDQTGLEHILNQAYTQLTTLRTAVVGGATTTEIRAGSGDAVARTIGDLDLTLSKIIAVENPTSIQDMVAKAMASKIHARIAEFFDGTGSACTWHTPSSINQQLITWYPNVTFGTDNTYSRFKELAALSSSSDKSKLSLFPTNFGIPKGASVLLFNNSPSSYTDPDDPKSPYDSDAYANFFYNFTTIDVSGMGMGNVTVGADHYLFPAELCYFGNSALRVSATEFTPGQYPDGAVTWETDSNWGAAWSVGHVESGTSSVAIKDNINYGTALLQTTVQYGAATLNDNNGGIHPGEADNAIDVTVPGAFKLTGVIIGGQTNTLGWNFLPKTSSSFNYLIYDGVVSNSAIPAHGSAKPESAPIYTMVMDNYNPNLDATHQSPVYVGLEFVNNTGTDFWGMHNLIPKGGTFYIIGKMDPYADGAITFPSNYDLPPYTSTTDATSLQIKRVFIQSFKTEAHFYLTANSLKSAYVTVPDLRSTELSLGMSVDVTWHSGINFSRIELGAL